MSIDERVSKIQNLSGLPRQLDPPRDLWPGIAAQISTEYAGKIPLRPTRRADAWTLRWAMPLAAGLAALAVGILLGRWSAPEPGNLSSFGGNRGEVATGALLEATFVAERDQLRDRVLARVRSMPQQQRDQLLSNVIGLQRAVEEIQRALGADPANELLQELLVGACQQEMTQLNDINLATGGVPAVNTMESRL